MAAVDEQFQRMLEQRLARDDELEAMLLARRGEIDAELDLVRSRRANAADLYTAEFGVAPPDTPLVAPTPLPAIRQTPAPGPYTDVPWLQAIESVLIEAGTPLHVRDIWSKLVAGGFHTTA